ncbi:NAD(P)(+)--arginine ADP-ribosyltransferase 2-like [Thamnophis elegans]|uniref:NAD(P)(+)--arginine ADP-ribosyltransferase 2-like n=1 Tax=Thamnophis elegans TaxID=35005 RepID=UPI0013770B9D|nr:NAD(P)(+)--arginine ADP-ribosyltransferase 2-like [Thamnophis elegans]
MSFHTFSFLGQVLCLQKIPLGMSTNSVDDRYIGCNPRRELKLLKPGYIPIPIKYMAIWRRARSHWAKLGQTVGKFNPTYGTAIVAYTISSNLYRDFNNAARQAGRSQSSYNHYSFKDFHLLLTKALQAKRIQNKCYEVFRGIRDIHFTVHSKQFVRFGQFASSSLLKNKAQAFGTGTLFSIKTCHGVPIYDFSYYPSEMEVLIPPYEMFFVKGHKGRIIRLESLGVASRFNCEVLKGKRLEVWRTRGSKEPAQYRKAGLLLT